MAVGDTPDIVNRIRLALPRTWFPNSPPSGPSNTPILDGVLTGLGSVWAAIYALHAYAGKQSRIASATDMFLDIIAEDFFAGSVFRKPGQLDPQFSLRIRKEIIRPRATRASVIQVVSDLTGRVPIVFEPALTTDTGGWGHIGMTTGTHLEYAGGSYPGAGGWGSLALPFQFFITAFRATSGGIPGVAGYYTGSGWAGGGYGHGAIEWGSLSMTQGQITDSDIDAAITSVIPAATIAWTAVTN